MTFYQEHWPDVEIPTRFNSAFEYLKYLAEKGLARKKGISEKYRSRLDRELKVIHEKKLAEYILFMREYVEAAKASGVLPIAYGCGLCSLVNYVLGITVVDPVKNGFIFERYLNRKQNVHQEILVETAENCRSEDVYDPRGTLFLLQEMLKDIKGPDALYIDMDTFPLYDEKTFELLNRNETKGIFSFEGEGITTFIRKLKPRKYEELVALVSMYRPPTLTVIDKYIERRRRSEPFVYFHPLLEPILEETNGLLIYQEQTLNIIREIGGMSQEDAEMFRKALDKRAIWNLENYYHEFFAGAAAYGMSHVISNDIYEYLFKYSPCCFMRCHAWLWTWIGYLQLYMKGHFPKRYRYYAEWNEPDNKDDFKEEKAAKLYWDVSMHMKIVRETETGEWRDLCLPLERACRGLKTLVADYWDSSITEKLKSDTIGIGPYSFREVTENPLFAIMGEREK